MSQLNPILEGFASTLAVFFAQLAYLVIMVLVLFTPMTVLGAIAVFAGFLLVGLIIQTTLSVMLQLEEKRTARQWGNNDVYF